MQFLANRLFLFNLPDTNERAAYRNEKYYTGTVCLFYIPDPELWKVVSRSGIHVSELTKLVASNVVDPDPYWIR